MSLEQSTEYVFDPRYPVGKFQRPERDPLTGALPEGELAYALSVIAELPSQLRNAVGGLDTEQMNTRYREGGWTVRQVVSHIADSHMTAFFRVRLALTEEWPTILAYDEKAFAELHDSVAAPVEWSLELIEAVHARWVMMLQSLTEAQWQRGFNHPERGPSTIELATLLYAWHCRHHLAHITHLRAAKNW
jgi:uncharacterized damage-inducible protein DinB